MTPAPTFASGLITAPAMTTVPGPSRALRDTVAAGWTRVRISISQREQRVCKQLPAAVFSNSESDGNARIGSFLAQPLPIADDWKPHNFGALQLFSVVHEASEFGLVLRNQDVRNNLSMSARTVDKDSSGFTACYAHFLRIPA